MRFTKLYLKHFAVILSVIGGGIGLLATIPSPFFERDMVEYYCASGSLFLGKDLSRFFYCGWIVYFFHVFALMLALFLGATVIDLLGKRSKILEIEPVNEINTQITSEPFLGSSYGVGLKIYNKTDYEITECFGTLESVQQVFIMGHKLILNVF